MQSLVVTIFPSIARLNAFLVAMLVLSFIYFRVSSKNYVPNLVALLIVFNAMNPISYLQKPLLGIPGFQPAHLAWLLTFVVVLNSRVKSGEPLGFSIFVSTPFLIYMIVNLIAFVRTFTAGPDHSFYLSGFTRSDLFFGYFLNPVQILLTGWMVMLNSKNPEDMRVVQRGILISSIAFSVILTVAYLWKGALAGGHSGFSLGRAMLGEVSGLHPNTLGGLSFYYFVASSTLKMHRAKVLSVVAIGMSLLGVLFTLSRMAWYATVFVGILSFIKATWRMRIIVILAAFMVYWQFHTLIINRIHHGTEQQVVSEMDKIDNITAGRLSGAWIPALRQIAQNPVFGTGSMTMVVVEWYGGGSAHNAYLKVLLDTGIIGAIVVAAMMVNFWRRARKKKGAFYYAMIGMCAMGFVGHSFFPRKSNYLFWLLYGIDLNESQENIDGK